MEAIGARLDVYEGYSIGPIPGKVLLGGIYKSKRSNNFRVLVTGLYYQGDITDQEPTVRFKRLDTIDAFTLTNPTTEGRWGMFVDAFEEE